MASAWYIALPFNILVTVAAGLAFYEADCRFIRNMKYLKFKAKRKNVKVTKEELKELAKLEDNK